VWHHSWLQYGCALQILIDMFCIYLQLQYAKIIQLILDPPSAAALTRVRNGSIMFNEILFIGMDQLHRFETVPFASAS
jgi:hypothetical protein